MIEGATEAISTLAKSIDNRRKRMEATPIAAVYSTFTPRREQITNCYYLLTEIPTLKIKESGTAISKTFISSESNQVSLILLAKEMHNSSKPMEGIELEALYLTMKKLRQTNPDSML